MDAVHSEAAVASFMEGLRDAPRRALLLDYDGTLAPFRADREAAVPYPGVRQELRALAEQGATRLVLVTGRPAAQVPGLLGLEGLEVWGCHAWERLAPEGTLEQMVPPAEAQAGLDEAARWLEGRGWARHTERKVASIALHWRGLEPQEAERMEEEASERLARLAERRGLEPRRFDGGLELCARGRDKGTAVETVLREEGERAAIAYLGDDASDEDAFRALRGRGLPVLVNGVARDTAAEARLASPGEVLDFLAAWRERVGG